MRLIFAFLPAVFADLIGYNRAVNHLAQFRRRRFTTVQGSYRANLALHMIENGQRQIAKQLIGTSKRSKLRNYESFISQL